jgi:starvation-inducible outer membrane lipoprotein
MRISLLTLVSTFMLAGCASGPPKLASCDGSNLRPINRVLGSESQPATRATQFDANNAQH